MTWTPRSGSDVRKGRDLPDPPEARVRRLACGHKTKGAPTVTGIRVLYTCPQGCGLVRRIA